MTAPDVPVRPVPPRLLDPAPGVDIEACLANFGRHAPGLEDLEKDPDDLLRYVRAIKRAQPQVIVEVGAGTGASANWLAQRVGEVISVDIDFARVNVEPRSNVLRVRGDSIDPRVSEDLYELIERRRCMVILDSEHTAEHVEAEIRLWHPYVSAGCYLVIEDTIYHWRPHETYDWNPYLAVCRVMPYLREFYRELSLEALTPITGAPAGWWRRSGLREVEVVRSDLLGGWGRPRAYEGLDPCDR